MPEADAANEAELKSWLSYVVLIWIGQFVALPVPTLVNDTMLPDALADKNAPSDELIEEANTLARLPELLPLPHDAVAVLLLIATDTVPVS
jgi:hypothetical protein